MKPIKTHRRTRSSNDLELQFMGGSPRGPVHTVQTLFTYSEYQSRSPEGMSVPKMLRASEKPYTNKIVMVETLETELGQRQHLAFLEFGKNLRGHSNMSKQ